MFATAQSIEFVGLWSRSSSSSSLTFSKAPAVVEWTRLAKSSTRPQVWPPSAACSPKSCAGTEEDKSFTPRKVKHLGRNGPTQKASHKQVAVSVSTGHAAQWHAEGLQQLHLHNTHVARVTVDCSSLAASGQEGRSSEERGPAHLTGRARLDHSGMRGQSVQRSFAWFFVHCTRSLKQRLWLLVHLTLPLNRAASGCSGYEVASAHAKDSSKISFRAHTITKAPLPWGLDKKRTQACTQS